MPAAPSGSAPSEFELSGWHVQPSLNRLRRGEVTVRLEPKMMDVLVALAARPGEVLSKDELADAVWPNLFVTEAVVTRAIAGLRRALEDDARTPRFIETIAKRGYRLLAVPAAITIAAEAGRRAAPTPATPLARTVATARSSTEPATAPYAAGQWVRGERFYGREGLLAEALSGPRNGIWLLGSRAIGKTSTLKQLALLAAGDGNGPYVPLFWDLQGCERPADLEAGFHEALAEAEESLAAADLALADFAAGDFFASLARLRRASRARGRTLLLLLDEAEELLALQAHSPSLLRKLRSALQAQEGVRTVLAASSRLWRLAGVDGDTSPFLHGFAPPVYLGALDEEASRHLVRQSRAGHGEPGVDERVVDGIVEKCGGHPYVLQLLCTRYWQLGDLDAAIAAVGADPGLHHLFAVDFGLLAAGEQDLLARLAAAAPARPLSHAELPGSPGELAASLLHLERLGVLRRPGGRVEIASEILAGWLRERCARPA
jgi:DNA-binding winged helix-turn-helix (wHTH) protein